MSLIDDWVGAMVAAIEARGELDNTVVVVSGDHGAPGFPGGKCNLYDFGVQVPLAIWWPRPPRGPVGGDIGKHLGIGATI